MVAIARLAGNPMEKMPEILDYTVAQSSGLASYLAILLKKARQEEKYDFILCGHLHLMPIAWLVSKWLRIPILLEIYGIEAWKPTSRGLTDRLANKAQIVTSISEFTRRKFLSWAGLPESNCVLLPNAIHTAEFGIQEPAPAFLKHYGLEGRNMILTFGRLVSKERAKGFDEVLELMPELIKKVPDIIYVIAGDGPDRKRLETKTQQLGVERHVLFTGRINEEDKSDLYHAAKVFVMPSKGEGFGFVFLEAMACGIPVIASNQDGSLEAVCHGQLGQVVNPDQPEDILCAILKALQMPKQVPAGLEQFSFENFSQKVFSVIDRMTAHG